MRLWDLKSQQAKPIQVLEDAKDSITSLLIADTYILTGCVDGHVRTYDLRNGQLTSDFFERLSFHIRSQNFNSKSVWSDPVTSIALTKDERAMLISTLNSELILIDCESGTMLAKYTGHKNTTYRCRHALDANNELVCAGDEDGKLFTWDLSSVRPVSPCTSTLHSLMLRTEQHHRTAKYRTTFRNGFQQDSNLLVHLSPSQPA